MINDFIAITDNFYTKEQCEEYINFIESFVEVPIKLISVGPDRKQTIIRKK